MPRFYGTFRWDSPLVDRYVVVDAPDRAAAHLDMDRRFGRWGTIVDELTWTATNWQGHTHAQRLGLTELTALEEEQWHEDRDAGHQRP